MGTGEESEAGSRSRVFFQGLLWFSKDATFISFRPMAGGAMVPATCKSSDKMLNPRGLDKREELLKFVPVKAGSEFKFMLFQCQKLEGLFSHSETFTWLYRWIIITSPSFKASDINCSKKARYYTHTDSDSSIKVFVPVPPSWPEPDREKFFVQVM